jgi:hypothetical protein
LGEVGSEDIRCSQFLLNRSIRVHLLLHVSTRSVQL